MNDAEKLSDKLHVKNSIFGNQQLYHERLPAFELFTRIMHMENALELQRFKFQTLMRAVDKAKKKARELSNTPKGEVMDALDRTRSELRDAHETIKQLEARAWPEGTTHDALAGQYYEARMAARESLNRAENKSASVEWIVKPLRAVWP